MKPQFINYLFPSTLLFIDNVLAKNGEAFYNVGSKFYPINNYFNGYYAYAAPHKQFIYDSNISGATAITGVYVNNVFVGTGVSGFAGINYEEGMALFTNKINGIVSGNYSAKEISVKSINENQESLLVETKFYNKNKVTSPTGNLTNMSPYPVIYVRSEAEGNDAFAFGGEDNDINIFKLSVFADSQYQVDAIIQLFKDKERTYYPVFLADEMPFNQLGGLRSGIFNYENYKTPKILDANSAYISDVYVTKFNSQSIGEIKNINPEIYIAVIDITTEFLRYPRVC